MQHCCHVLLFLFTCVDQPSVKSTRIQLFVVMHITGSKLFSCQHVYHLLARISKMKHNIAKLVNAAYISINSGL